MRKPDEASATSVMTLYRVFGSNEPGQALEQPKVVAGYRRYDLERLGATFDEIDVLLAGARVKF